jgi:hypothetical protein
MRIKIFNDNGRPWVVRIKDNSNTIDFFDARFEITDLGQFVSSYYINSIQSLNGALCLNIELPEWSLSKEAMDRIRQWISTFKEM